MSLIDTAREAVESIWNGQYVIRKHNQAKVLRAFQLARVGSHCFHDSTGYGYDDAGRDALEAVYAHAFGAEAALVRPQVVSGTHAITLALGLLLPGDEVISLSGPPYDTLQQVIGTAGTSKRSLLQRGIQYREIPLTSEGTLDLAAVRSAVTTKTRMVLLQRSRGYSWRPSLEVAALEQAINAVKSINSDCICFVDNCYGEFVEHLEPTEVGADLMAGSLIKNPGGTLAISGGYIVGRQALIDEVAEGLTAPGIGARVGPMFGLSRSLLQGFFMAPHVVGEALAGAVLAAQVFSELGFRVSPLPESKRTDIIQAIEFGDRATLLSFCAGVQKASAVDAHYAPIPGVMPGYEDEVVMAGGTFIQGSSIELSADAPMRTPYIGYLQGGFSREHVELVLEGILKDLPH